MKFVTNRPYSVSERAGRKIVEIANSVEAVQDGRILHRSDQRAFPVLAGHQIGDGGVIVGAVNIGLLYRMRAHHR
jgi:hypothetical protein